MSDNVRNEPICATVSTENIKYRKLTYFLIVTSGMPQTSIKEIKE